MTKRSIVKSKFVNQVLVKWLLRSEEDPDGLIRLKSINVVVGYIQVPAVEFVESFLSVASDNSTRILM